MKVTIKLIFFQVRYDDYNSKFIITNLDFDISAA